MAQAPSAPTARVQTLRGDYASVGEDYRVEQAFEEYTAIDHDVWSTLCARQLALMPTHAAPEFLSGLRMLDFDLRRIPSLEATSDILHRLTGWRLVGVPGLIPERNFFAFLAAREFPVTVWMRRPEELDYLVEPDLFHDFFGHLPMLTHPVFANYVQEYGRRGSEASSPATLKCLARLYWYTVEFGLIDTPLGRRAFGAGILSSRGETVYALEATKPPRLAFDLRRVLATDYLIDSYQQRYFVLESFEQLFDSVLEADLEALSREVSAAA
jgi:phenylalanine-4-hydroxylase